MNLPSPRRRRVAEPSVTDRLRRLDEVLVHHYESTRAGTQIDLEYIRQEAARRHQTARQLGIDPVTAEPKHEQIFTITVTWSRGRLVLTMPTVMIYGAKILLSVFFGLLGFVLTTVLGKSSMVSAAMTISLCGIYLLSLLRRPPRAEDGRLRGLRRCTPLIMQPPSTEASDKKRSAKSA
ncbi:hypothetical protein [Streptomyces sp. NPDC127108]|uniref:hypothetical protein n=1 Tax=Streptomyces sp. NPDC127108 TaxID=3345361 RepID=UPI00363E1D05